MYNDFENDENDENDDDFEADEHDDDDDDDLAEEEEGDDEGKDILKLDLTHQIDTSQSKIEYFPFAISRRIASSWYQAKAWRSRRRR